MEHRSDRSGKIRWWVWAVLVAVFLLGVLVGVMIW